MFETGTVITSKDVPSDLLFSSCSRNWTKSLTSSSVEVSRPVLPVPSPQNFSIKNFLLDCHVSPAAKDIPTNRKTVSWDTAFLNTHYYCIRFSQIYRGLPVPTDKNTLQIKIFLVKICNKYSIFKKKH